MEQVNKQAELSCYLKSNLLFQKCCSLTVFLIRNKVFHPDSCNKQDPWGWAESRSGRWDRGYLETRRSLLCTTVVLAVAPAPVWAVTPQWQDSTAEGAGLRHKGSVTKTSSQRQGCAAGGGDAAFSHAGQRALEIVLNHSRART